MLVIAEVCAQFLLDVLQLIHEVIERALDLALGCLLIKVWVYLLLGSLGLSRVRGETLGVSLSLVLGSYFAFFELLHLAP